MEIERELLERLFERFPAAAGADVRRARGRRVGALHVDSEWSDRELVEKIALLINAPD